MKSTQLPIMASFILKKWPLLFLIISINLISSCAKDEDSATPTPTNVDLTGLYTGTITQSNARTAAGDDQMEIRLKSDRTYIFTALDNGLKFDFAEATVTGKNFTGTGIAPFEDITNLKGNLAGDEINFTFINEDTNYSYTGIRPSTGGGSGGGNGFAGPAEYTSGSISISVDGKSFNLTDIDGSGVNQGGFLLEGTDDADGELELYATGISGPGTYDADGFTWDEDRYTYDTIETNLKDAITITSISESSVIGAFSFSYDGKSFSGTFNLTK